MLIRSLLHLCLVCALPGAQDSPNPPVERRPHVARASPRPRAPQPEISGPAVRAVVVKSWSPAALSTWPELEVEWPSYGSVPIEVDVTTLGDVPGFDHDDLVASGADVVILSDPAGGLQQFSQVEIDALRLYARQGHNVIGTFLVFGWKGIDNSELAPVFGLRPDLSYTSFQPLSNRFHALERSNPLLEGLLPGSLGKIQRLTAWWQSSGWPNTELPDGDLRWDDSDLAGAKIVAQCDGRRGIISVFAAPEYYGIFISNMPEYFGGPLDKQLLYNAITLPPP